MLEKMMSHNMTTKLAGFLEQEVRLFVMHSGVIYKKMAW
jgi:hypothetical protein